MQGNSLLEQYKGVDLSTLTQNKKDQHEALQVSMFDDQLDILRKKLRKYLDDYFLTTDHQIKTRLRQQIKDNVNQQLHEQHIRVDFPEQYDIAANTDFFLWHTWFADVFNRPSKQGFDIVIGNPPYLTVKRGEFPMYEWNTDLYKMFFEIGIKRLINNSGLLSYITPKFYLVNLDDEKMREYLMDNMHIDFLSFCNPFDVVTENVITMLRKDKSKQTFVRVYRQDEESKVFNEALPLDMEYSKTNLHKEWVTGIDSNVLAILTKMGLPIKLRDISSSKRGAEISKKDMRATQSGLPSLIGQDMKKYSINWSNTYLDINHKEYYRLSPFFSKEMIYLRRVDICLEATIGDIIYGFNKNVYGIKIDETKGYNRKFVLALLNSKALDYYYRKKFSTKKEDVFPEIQTYLYEQLPIPRVSEAQQQPIVELVDKIISYKRINPLTDTSEWERQIDKLVYDLYDLDDNERKLIEEE